MVILYNRAVDYGIVLPRVVTELSGAIAVTLNSRTFDHLFIDLLSVLFCFAVLCLALLLFSFTISTATLEILANLYYFVQLFTFVCWK